MQIEKDANGNDWATFSEAEIEAMLRREIGDKRLSIVQFIHPRGEILNGWCRAQVMIEKEGR